MVQGEGEEDGKEGGVKKTGQLGSGESLKTAMGVRVVLELPHNALFELEELTEIERPPGGGDGDEGQLYLRVGRVRTTVLEEGFKVDTPVVEVMGKAGAIFHTRVVLDASTIVEVERGSVEVLSLRGKKKKWLLKEGMVGRFDSRGGGSIENKGAKNDI